MQHKYLLFIFLLFFFGIVFSQEEPSSSFSFKWDDGFKLTTPNNKFGLEFGGRLMIDHANISQDDKLTANFGPLDSRTGTEIRRARLFVAGDAFKNIHFKFQVDFAGDEIGFKDVYLGFSELPWIGNFRVGHFKDPIRLSALNSSKYITFMEIAQNSAFAPLRNNGIIIFNEFLEKRLSAQLAAFRNADNYTEFVFKDDGYVVTGRVAGIALKDSINNQLLHLGMAYSYRKPESKEYRVSAKPGSNLAPRYISTGILTDVEDIKLINFETAYIYGSFSFQGEYLNSTVSTNTSTLNFSNYYGELSYFITGESKNYKGSYGGFGRLNPKKNFNKKDKGAGAWEVALRFSNTDLTNKNVLGGKQNDITVGLNWYLNPFTRLMVNHVWVNIEDEGSARILQGRLQIDF